MPDSGVLAIVALALFVGGAAKGVVVSQFEMRADWLLKHKVDYLRLQIEYL